MRERKSSFKNLLRFLIFSLIISAGIRCPYSVEASRQKITYEDGDKYIGNINDDTKEKSGSGKYFTAKGVVISGKWKNDFLTGKATVIYPNKEKYVGYFKWDKRNGSGTYYFKNGDRYKGSWKNDKMNGKGTYTWKNRNYVKGSWKSGKLNGTATFKKGKYRYSIKVSKGKLKKVYSRKRVK